MRARRDDFDTRFSAYLEHLSAKSAHRLGQFGAASTAHHNAVDLALASHGRRIELSLGDGLARFEGALDGRSRELVTQVGERSDALANDLAAKLAAIEETLVTRGGAIGEQLSRRNEEAAAEFERGLQALDERASAELRDVSGSIESLLGRIDEGLALRGRTVSETLARNTLETARVLGEGGRELISGAGRQVGRNRRDAAEPRQCADRRPVRARHQH